MHRKLTLQASRLSPGLAPPSPDVVLSDAFHEVLSLNSQHNWKTPPLREGSDCKDASLTWYLLLPIRDRLK